MSYWYRNDLIHYPLLRIFIVIDISRVHLKDCTEYLYTVLRTYLPYVAQDLHMFPTSFRIYQTRSTATVQYRGVVDSLDPSAVGTIDPWTRYEKSQPSNDYCTV